MLEVSDAPHKRKKRNTIWRAIRAHQYEVVAMLCATGMIKTKGFMNCIVNTDRQQLFEADHDWFGGEPPSEVYRHAYQRLIQAWRSWIYS
jgi:hypothetical protein